MGGGIWNVLLDRPERTDGCCPDDACTTPAITLPIPYARLRLPGYCKVEEMSSLIRILGKISVNFRLELGINNGQGHNGPAFLVACSFSNRLF